jgi:hypothetical protein
MTHVTVTRNSIPTPVLLELLVNGARIAQRTVIIVTDPLILTVLPYAHDILPLRVQNPSGEPFVGQVVEYSLPDPPIGDTFFPGHVRIAGSQIPLKLASGVKEKILPIAVSEDLLS